MESLELRVDILEEALEGMEMELSLSRDENLGLRDTVETLTEARLAAEGKERIAHALCCTMERKLEALRAVFERNDF